MSLKILILDDDVVRHNLFEKWFPDDERTHVFSAHEASSQLESETFEMVFLDHDLNHSEFTGQHVARHIAALEWTARPKAVIIHSMNPVGAGRMYQELVDKVDEVSIIPFSTLIEFRT